MENYEVKGVSNASEIKKAYTEAVAGNNKYYRAISKTNQIYGWNENTNNFVKAQAGQEWFENPHYEEPSVEEPIEETIEETIEEKADILEEMVEVANEMVEEVKAEEVVEEVKEEVDYKALYEEKCGEFDELKKCYEVLQNDLSNYKVKVGDFLDSLEELKKL